ncbi:MAG TPA: hypothetical protein VFD43_01580 [Planctomycetota bacterium]|nr:hypothetical protein [Planctomycetota bacterium]
MPFKLAVTAALLLALVAPSASAQSTLADGSCVVVTGDGLYLVAQQVTTKVFDTTPFGGSLVAPSVTWIDGTNVVIVTTKDDAAGGPGGVWRVTLVPGGTGTVTDLTPTLPGWIEPHFIDADYAPGLDVLFLLQGPAGQVASWARPAQDSLASLEPWGTVPPDDARSIAVNGAKQPFAIAVALGSGPVVRVGKLGTVELYPEGAWNDIASNPVTGALIVAKQAGDTVGQIASAMLLFDFNVSGFCGPLVPQPADVEWDAVAGRAVAIAGAAMPACAATIGATGDNHILRLPLTAGGGPASNQPVLLTPVGASGITGKRADIALVRHGASEVSYWGFPAPGAGTSEPTFGHSGALALGKSAQLDLKQAPPSAAALLVIGLHPAPSLLQGQLILPAQQLLLPAVTSAEGQAQRVLPLPAGATAFVGLEVYMQWVVLDTTTAAAGDAASSQAAVFTIGVE